MFVHLTPVLSLQWLWFVHLTLILSLLWLLFVQRARSLCRVAPESSVGRRLDFDESFGVELGADVTTCLRRRRRALHQTRRQRGLRRNARPGP